MIFDAENLFFNNKALSNGTLTSDIIYMGPGEAGDPMTLVVATAGTGSGALSSVVLKTSASSDMSSAVTLGTYTGAVKTKVPRGNLGYLQLTVTSSYTAGTVTAGLVPDDDIAWQ